MVNVFYEDTKTLDKTPEFFDLWFGKICHTEGRLLGDVSVVFCSDTYLLELNKRHLQHDFFTDIITFDYSEGDRVAGDLFVSVDRVYENADAYNVSRETELNRVSVHGILHLLGYKDKTPQEVTVMREKENEALALL
ncbi:MAG: rRNA maturation RNase YbeY [Crocinitomicaceae bacterium]|jgi:probable rRNA maturation factor|nr:rRNA maturation RNase YbeY [Crocinitomicaceae bacterium]